MQEVDQQAIEAALGIELGKEDEDEDEEQEGSYLSSYISYHGCISFQCTIAGHVIFPVLKYGIFLQLQMSNQRMRNQQPLALMMRQARKLPLSSRNSFLKRYEHDISVAFSALLVLLF